MILKTDVGVKLQDHLFAHFTFECTISMLKRKGFKKKKLLKYLEPWTREDEVGILWDGDLKVVGGEK